MAEIVWQKPIKDTWGGYLSHTSYAGTTLVSNSTNYMFCGFSCQRNNYFLLGSNQYESTNYQSFLRFDIPSVVGDMTECLLYLWFYGGKVVEAFDAIDYPEVEIWAKHDYSSSEFPWQSLGTDDYSAGWTRIGSLGGIKQFVRDTNQGWFVIDATTLLQSAIDNGWDYFAIRLIPSYVAPSNWSYATAPFIGTSNWDSVNEECYATFLGVGTQEWAGTVPGTYEIDTGYDWISKSPVLKITYDIPSPPTPPTTTVNIVAADAKAKVCLAGTTSGKLWRVDKISSGWRKEKVFELFRRYVSVDYEITAIYIDSIRNFKDCPQTAIIWVGTSDGRLYKSSSSLKYWDLISNINSGADSFVEIRGSELDSDKVVVGVGAAIHTTVNGGMTWRTVAVKSQAVTGLFVRGNEIQVVYGSAGAFRSPDFGTTWYITTGEPYCYDIAFSKRDKKKSVLLASGNLYKYDSGETVFSYTSGAAIAGTPTSIDGDLDAELIIIGTSSNLYQTIDWGSTVQIVKAGANVKSASIGGGYLYNP